MAKTQGTLTGTQLEIMEVVWDGDAEGVTASEIWQELAQRREVARTTVLTMVRRLEQRGWLAGARDESPILYQATRSRDRTTDQLATDFVDRFFGGSPEELVKSLLGSRKVNRRELHRIRKLIEEMEERR